jgi:hypothetical protein
MFGTLVEEAKFEQLRQSEDCELSEFQPTDDENDRKTHLRKLPITLVSLLLVATSLVSAALGALSGMTLFQEPDKYCFERNSQFCKLVAASNGL